MLGSFLKINGQNEGYIFGMLEFKYFLGCLKFMIFCGVNGRKKPTYEEKNERPLPWGRVMG